MTIIRRRTGREPIIQVLEIGSSPGESRPATLGRGACWRRDGSSGSGRKIIGILVVVAIGQVIGWGTVGLLAVVGREVAADLGMDISAVFAGNSIFYVATGLSSAGSGPGIHSGSGHGTMIFQAASLPRRASSCYPIADRPGVVLRGMGHPRYRPAARRWGPATYILLNEIVGRAARRAIGALMLVTGLASSVFWPTTSFLSGVIGWRGTCLVYAGLMVFVCCRSTCSDCRVTSNAKKRPPVRRGCPARPKWFGRARSI